MISQTDLSQPTPTLQDCLRDIPIKPLMYGSARALSRELEPLDKAVVLESSKPHP